MSLQIRLAQQRDIAHLMAVERSAAQLFRQQPEWRFIAEGEVMAPKQHAAFIAERREWLAESDNGECAGFIAVLAQGEDWHVAELSVAAAWQRQGVGRRLIGAVVEEAKRQGVTRLTLTTFIDVPWNAPYYGGWDSGRSTTRGSRSPCGGTWMRIWRTASPSAVAVPWNLHYRKY